MSDLLADSLAHATLTGTWMGQPAGAGFDALDAALAANNYAFACAVGMWGMDGYAADAYARACRQFPRLVPVAGVDPLAHAPARLMDDLGALRDMGFRGIKLHSRFSGFDPGDPAVAVTMEAAGQLGLVVFWCTFHHTVIDRWPGVDPFLSLLSHLRAAPSAKVILLHGGDVDLLRHMQLARFNNRVLLDLSHTIAKYPGSSLDQDIRFLFRHFDQRICLGTDWPQFSHATLRERYEYFAAGVDPGRRQRIGWENLAGFLGIA